MSATRVDFPFPLDAKADRCKACGATIVWVETASGKRMPLSTATAAPDPSGQLRAISHFADCPNAAEFRRKGGDS
jgi:hypothetical protein